MTQRGGTLKPQQFKYLTIYRGYCKTMAVISTQIRIYDKIKDLSYR